MKLHSSDCPGMTDEQRVLKPKEKKHKAKKHLHFFHSKYNFFKKKKPHRKHLTVNCIKPTGRRKMIIQSIFYYLTDTKYSAATQNSTKHNNVRNGAEEENAATLHRGIFSVMFLRKNIKYFSE